MFCRHFFLWGFEAAAGVRGDETLPGAGLTLVWGNFEVQVQ